jgi:predicted nucleic acid-binding Zn ribbon protein
MAVKSLENLLNPNKDGDLANIVQRARASILAANVREDGELVVICRSPAWASRLRFTADVLLEAARAQGAEASRCSVRVARSD